MAVRLSFRPATADDAPAVATLVQSGYRGDPSPKTWTTEAGLLTGARITADGVIEKITSPQSYVILAYEVPESTPTGEQGPAPLLACFELVKKSDKVGYFGLFTVDPSKQAGGIGRQVLAEAERRAKLEMGVARMEMTVIWTRAELIAWYERRGYRIIMGAKSPFPYDEIVGNVLRDDLYFIWMGKDL